MNKKPEERSNKSSIVRSIISNFDEKNIKEFKVHYTKQGGVDSFSVHKMEYKKEKGGEEREEGRILFAQEHVEPISKNGNVEIENAKSEGSLLIIKKDWLTKEITRKYEVSGSYIDTNKGQRKVRLIVKDLRPIQDAKKRRETTWTERVLLDEKTIECYKKITGGKEK